MDPLLVDHRAECSPDPGAARVRHDAADGTEVGLCDCHRPGEAEQGDHGKKSSSQGTITLPEGKPTYVINDGLDVYENYYRFARQPFSLTPDPEFLFKSRSHRAALDQLLRGIRRGDGFFLLSGDVGTGKTTICRSLVEQLGRQVFTALVLNPFVTQDELLRATLLDFGVVSRDESRTGPFAWATKQQLIETLNHFLVSLAQVGATAVVVVDEAQNLSPPLLEGIRLLSNLETDNRKLLQILLVGQPELVTTLEDDGMRQLRQRIARRVELCALTREELEQYVTYRLRIASGDGGGIFNERALDLVYEFSSGVPRMINLICDRSLEVGFAARSPTITEDLVLEAAELLELRRQATAPPRFPRAAGVASAVDVASLAVGPLGGRGRGRSGRDRHRNRWRTARRSVDGAGQAGRAGSAAATGGLPGTTAGRLRTRRHRALGRDDPDGVCRSRGDVSRS